jgi:hypothetical protein
MPFWPNVEFGPYQPGGPLYEPPPSFIGTSAGPMIEDPLAPMMGQQLQPTGLQGLQQGMGQGFNSQYPNYISQPIRPIMNQNMQGFGMQSPVPFGTQQPFSSGFGGFGQQQGYNR